MRVALTGSTGFIGRHVLPVLLEHAHAVRILVRNQSENSNGVEVVRGALADVSAVEALVRQTEVVIHLAGVAHSELNTEAERRHAQQVNVEGTKNVLECALRGGIRRVVLASSVHVYQHQSGAVIDEESPQRGENFYAETKIEVERLAREFGSKGLEILIGRPCLTYGPGVRYNLFRLVRAIDRGAYFHVSGRHVARSFGSVYTAAEAFVFLAERGTPGEAYNIADRDPASLEDFTNELADRLHRNRPRRVPYSALWTAAAGCSLVKHLGLPVPITMTSLRKLTESFSVSTSKLWNAGFRWLDDGNRGRQAMIEHYRAVHCP